MSTVTLSVRMDEELKESVERAAEDEAASISDYVREVVKADLYGEEEEDTVSWDQYADMVQQRDELQERVEELEMQKDDLITVAAHSAGEIYDRLNEDVDDIIEDHKNATAEIQSARNSVVNVKRDVADLDQQLTEIHAKVAHVDQMQEQIRTLTKKTSEVQDQIESEKSEQKSVLSYMTRLPDGIKSRLASLISPS